MFKDKFPIFNSLLVIVASAVHDTEKAIKDGGNALAAILDYEDLAPELLAFLPHVSGINAEIKMMGPADYAAAAEELVADLAIQNGSAQAIIRAAFPVVDKLAELEPLVMTLISQIKGAKAV